jgi:pyruvate-formate lyase-activating enzyme
LTVYRKETKTLINTLYADIDGTIYDEPLCRAVAFGGRLLTPKDLIPMPSGGQMMYLPGREAVFAQAGGQTKCLSGKMAVAAMLPVGYTRLYLPAYRTQKNARRLPLYGYTAAALYKNKIYVAAIKTDDNENWNPAIYNTKTLKKRIADMRRLFPKNRLVEHLANCSLNWRCFRAQNIFYNRFEAGIPISPVCNADCLGCISLQKSECCPAPQSRITFTPTPAEIAELGIYHLNSAPYAIVSFGQGCEGEPSLAFETITEAIGLIRQATLRGQININTNAGFTKGIKKITDKSLDSMRVSMISARDETYRAYHQNAYDFSNVAESVVYAKSRGVYISLNLLLFPGLTDRPEETESLIDFIEKTKIDMVQFRNLNIDPEFLLKTLPPGGAPLGVREFIKRLKTKMPNLKTGNSTPAI